MKTVAAGSINVQPGAFDQARQWLAPAIERPVKDRLGTLCPTSAATHD
jgi:hypothetical protein